MRVLLVFLILINLSTYAQSDYQKAWLALNKNSKEEAKAFLEKAMQNPSTAQQAFITNFYLNTYNGKDKETKDFVKNFYQSTANPHPYVYALWFNPAVMGDYGKKDAHQIELANLLIKDPKTHGTIQASANYQLGMGELFSNRFEKTSNYYNTIGNIRKWQYTGPFENISESGFDKDYGPLQHPEPSAVFQSLTNAEVTWVTPPSENWDGWTPTSYTISKQTAVVYAQSFVNSPSAQSIYCNAGFTGNIKVWINDELVISESQERVTDFDAYTTKVDLQKGVNRVLVQLGYTNSTYPNFSIRFTDNNYRPVPGITGSSTYASYPKSSTGKNYDLIPHFAEKYFQDKIASDSADLVNYLLLTDTYLRSKKLMEARNVVNKALKMGPNNPLVHFANILVLLQEDNRTLLLEEIEKVKEADPESLFVLDYQLKQLYDSEKFSEVEAELEKRIKLYGEDEGTFGYKIGILNHEKKYEDLIKLSEKMYQLYPENTNVLNMMYTINKEVYKNNKAAISVYENYMKNNYNNAAWVRYQEILTDMGKQDKALAIKETIAKSFPYSPSGFSDLAQYYYGIKQYSKAQDYINKALSLSSYDERYWASLGDILSEQKNTAKAQEAYERSLKYDPNQYDIINKIRKLGGKPELYKLLPTVDVNQVIKADKIDQAKNTDYGYYYILDQKDVVIYPEGATEEYFNTVLRITNQTGVDRYKETSIGYNNSQELLIEKAEIIKKNGARIEGEKYNNEIVFTNLEAGDIVYLKYRLQSFYYGRFAKEFKDKYYFGGKIYSAITRYNLLAPDDKKINSYFNKSGIKPEISSVENFKKYAWEILNPEPDKDEPLMPQSVDISDVLHISTIPAWSEISGWYADVINNRTEENHYLKEVYASIFPAGGKQMTEFQRGKKIYDYIEKNIRYSSVSFRQSAYIPQKAALTLTTRLGDCKDLSNLFVTLAKMAGIKAQMVLVDTRDNGVKDLVLPGMDFNHCIVKAKLDNKDYYLELTDSELPFASLPNNLMGALILEIPSKNGMPASELTVLNPVSKTKDIARRRIEIQPVGSDQKINVQFVKSGSLSSSVRNTYKTLDNEKRLKEMQEAVSNQYKNPVKVQKLSFEGLDNLEDSVVCNFSYQVNNEVAEIGAMQTFKINYQDVVASVDKFSAEDRTYPIEYWNYEDADLYETVVKINAPAGKKFIEIPASENFTFKNLKYSLQYSLKSPTTLVVTRNFTNDRPQQILPADYPSFKAFFEKIVKLEQKFIAYK